MNETALIQWMEAIRTLLIRKGARINDIDLRATGGRTGLIRWQASVDSQDEPDVRLPGMPTAQAALNVLQAYAENYAGRPREEVDAPTPNGGVSINCATKVIFP